MISKKCLWSEEVLDSEKINYFIVVHNWPIDNRHVVVAFGRPLASLPSPRLLSGDIFKGRRTASHAVLKQCQKNNNIIYSQKAHILTPQPNGMKESTLVDQKMRLSLKLFNHPNNILKQFVILVKQVSGFWIQSILLCIILHMIYHTATHIITIYGQYVTTPPPLARPSWKHCSKSSRTNFRIIII